ncbi:MAG: translocation/assembly module TamB domain-containing protein, partial [Candidatus Latescibacterota bacterium]
ANVRWGERFAFSGEVTLANTLDDLNVDLSGAVNSVVQDPANPLPNIGTNLSYRDGLLNIRSISVDDGKIRANVTGELPVDLDLRDGFNLRRSAPIHLEARVSTNDLSIVSGYVDAIAASRGRLEGSIGVDGTVDAPRFSGKLDFRDCAFRLMGSDEVYREIAANIHLRDDRITLTSLDGRKGKKGRFEGSGWARLDGFDLADYQISLTLKDLPFSSISGFESTQEGELVVRSQPSEDGRLVPKVGGSLKVKQAVITRSLAKQEGPPSPFTMPVASPRWLCDLEIVAPKNVWVKNPDLQMELGGDLILKRDQKGLYLRGDLNVLRGSYSLYNNKFRITEGRFDFATATTLRPGIYLDAYTPHGRAGEVERRIFLTLSWPADEKEPEITLSYSEPGYSEADIWAMLGGQVVPGGSAFTGEGAWDAGETASSLASNYLERMLNAQMSDYTIAVESRPVGRTSGTPTGENELSIAVGRYLSQDLYLNYRQGLRISSAREIDIEYRLSNMLLLRSEIIRHSQKGLYGKSRQTTDEINFDIKFRFEY